MSKTILYFTASWCGPCQRIKPTLYKLEEECPEIKVIAIDVDDDKGEFCKFPSKYKVSSLPTFVALHSDDEVERFEGADASKLKKLFEKLHKL